MARIQGTYLHQSVSALNNMNQKQTIEVVYPDGSTEGLIMTAVGPRLFRLEESSILGEGVFGDVVEGDLDEEGRLRFRRVATASTMKTVSCFLTADQMNAPGLSSLLEQVQVLGGNWEQALGGILLVHLPQSADLDVEAAIRGLVA